MSDEDQFDSDIEQVTAPEVGVDADSTDEEEALAAGDSAAVLAAKEQERTQLKADIDAFLASGGKITAVDNNVVSDPPKRPESSYGSQPI